MDSARLVTERSRRLDTSAVRRLFELGASLKNPINLAIGQPEFPVPDAIKRAACDAIMADRNGYTVAAGLAPLRERLESLLSDDLGWRFGAEATSARLIVTSGTSGALFAAMLAITQAGDEVVIPDPYFGFYPHMVSVAGGTPIYCDTYPDFRLTAARVEPLLTERTKAVVLNTPGNPSGVVATRRDCEDLAALCERRGVLLICDEIYAELTYGGAGEPNRQHRCPSAGTVPGAQDRMLIIRGFGKTYGVTGWRLGFAAGPAPIIEAMERMQQFMFICPPTPLQWGILAALDLDMSGAARTYERRAAQVFERLSRWTPVVQAQGAFYAFVEVPPRLGLSAEAFQARCLERNVLIMSGSAVSRRDTHIRLSFAVPDDVLDRGLAVIEELMRGG